VELRSRHARGAAVTRGTASGERDTKVHRDFKEAEMEIGIGLIRKALFIATLGLSGRLLKDNSKPQAAKKQARAAQAKPRAQKPQKATRSKPRSTRAGAVAKASAKGTAGELERLSKLHGEGALTDAEFSAGKAKILGTAAGRPEPTVQAARIAPYPAVEANVSAARQLDGLAGRERPSVASLNRD
jgi:hypothetical protein